MVCQDRPPTNSLPGEESDEGVDRPEPVDPFCDPESGLPPKPDVTLLPVGTGLLLVLPAPLVRLVMASMVTL